MSGTLTCAGFPVVEGRISLPRIGAWSAVLVVETETVPTGKVEIVTDSGLKFVGTVRHSGKVLAASNLFIAGGADGMGKPAAPKFYKATTARQVLADLVQGAGESLDSTTDALAIKLPFWSTVAMPTGEALAQLLHFAGGYLWRVLPGGGVWAGVESWPTCSVDHTLLEDQPEEQQWQIGLDSPEIVPGQTLDGKHVDRVEYEIKRDAVRATVWTL